MATIDEQGRGGSVTTAVVIRQTHNAVCGARSNRPHDHRNLCLHHRRGTRRKLVSEHRAVIAPEAETAQGAPLSESTLWPRRRVAVVALAVAAALGVLGLILLRTLDPAAGGRLVLLVVALAAIVCAVILNAETIESAGSSARTGRQPARGEQ